MFFSQSTGGFYDSEIHGDNIPADAVAITAAEHQILLDGQSAGKIITAGADGRPVLTDPSPPPPPTLADKAAYLAEVRWRAEQGGTVWNGMSVQTDDRSQSKYLSELAAIDQGVRADPSPWKLAAGFVMLSNADIKALSIAARAHVLACFAAEAGVQPSLDLLATLDEVAMAFAATLTQIKESTHA